MKLQFAGFHLSQKLYTFHDFESESTLLSLPYCRVAKDMSFTPLTFMILMKLNKHF